jgi:hypothetical protein
MDSIFAGEEREQMGLALCLTALTVVIMERINPEAAKSLRGWLKASFSKGKAPH